MSCYSSKTPSSPQLPIHFYIEYSSGGNGAPDNPVELVDNYLEIWLNGVRYTRASGNPGVCKIGDTFRFVVTGRRLNGKTSKITIFNEVMVEESRNGVKAEYTWVVDRSFTLIQATSEYNYISNPVVEIDVR